VLTVVFDTRSKQEWSFQSLFGKSEATSCPLASKSIVYVQQPNHGVLQPVPDTVDSSIGLSTYDLSLRRTLSLKCNATLIAKTVHNHAVTFNRYFTGFGEEFGGISVDIINNQEQSLDVKYFESIPWYLRLFFHTLHFNLNNKKMEYLQVLNNFTFTPADDHGAPATLEFSLTLHGRSHLSFGIEFEKAFLHWTEHPPDAHRGFDIGSSLLVVHINCTALRGLEWSPTLYPNNCKTQPSRLVTDSLLVTLPTPDFSMPYNVVTLTGTVFAMFFGSTYHTLIRRMKNMDKVNNEYVSNRPIARIFRKVLHFLDS